MRMPMMRIRHVWVGVLQGFMAMRVTVRAGGQYLVRMQMMPICLFGVVAVGVFMLQNLMRMQMAV